MLRRYQQFLIILCLWGAICCTYYFSSMSICIPWSQRFSPDQQTFSEYLQSSSVSGAIRVVLKLKEADVHPVKSGNLSQKGSPPHRRAQERVGAVRNDSAQTGLQAAKPPQSQNMSVPVKVVTSFSMSFSSSTAQPFSVPSTSSNTTSGTTDSQKSRKLICVSFMGRLGNQLFQYASTLGLALSQNRMPMFLDSKLLEKLLKNFIQPPKGLNITELKERCSKAKVIREASCCMFKIEMTELDPQHDYRVGLYLQSYRYFQSHEAEIQKAITFNDNIRAKADSIVKELRQRYNQSTLVGMHIRHGDMAIQKYQKLGYPLADSGYINKSMAFFRELYPNCTFVVSSDSLDWVKENFPKNYSSVHFLSKNEPALDMTILSSMDHVVTSFGTFSWWVGFLNSGKTVYMKDFIRANTRLGNVFKPTGRDYIYPGWIPL